MVSQSVRYVNRHSAHEPILSAIRDNLYMEPCPVLTLYVLFTWRIITARLIYFSTSRAIIGFKCPDQILIIIFGISAKYLPIETSLIKYCALVASANIFHVMHLFRGHFSAYTLQQNTRVITVLPVAVVIIVITTSTLGRHSLKIDRPGFQYVPWPDFNWCLRTNYNDYNH